LTASGPKPEALSVTSSNPAVVAITKEDKRPHHPHTITLTGKSLGTARVEAKAAGEPAGSGAVTTLSVEVVAPLQLPPANTEAGAIARLLIAENRSPYMPGYDEQASKKSMQWMRLILVNRLNNHPEQFGASGASSVVDIIKAPGQFEGFSGYPTLSA